MKKSLFSDEQIVRILQEAAIGQKSQSQLCREHGISENTFYTWKRKFNGLQSQDVPGQTHGDFLSFSAPGATARGLWLGGRLRQHGGHKYWLRFESAQNPANPRAFALQDVRRLKELEQENRQLKRLLAERDLEIDAVRTLVRKNGWALPSASRERGL